MPTLDEAQEAGEARVTADLSGAKEYIDAPNGTYEVEVNNVTFLKSDKGKGDPFVQFYMEVVNDDKHEGNRVPIVWASLINGGKSGKLNVGKLKTILRYCGLDVDSSEAVTFGTADVIGARLFVNVQLQKGEKESGYRETIITGSAVQVGAKTSALD
jgi:hypothetical protein